MVEFNSTSAAGSLARAREAGTPGETRITVSEGASIAAEAMSAGVSPQETGQALMNAGVSRADAQRMVEMGARRAHVSID